MSKKQANMIYASEAYLFNVALFGNAHIKNLSEGKIVNK